MCVHIYLHSLSCNYRHNVSFSIYIIQYIYINSVYYIFKAMFRVVSWAEADDKIQ